jgi:predicted metal-dependent HD superfamily phosphohydrolase
MSGDRSPREALQARWRDLIARLGADPHVAGPIYDALAAAYAEPVRHYHTLDHIAALFGLLDSHGGDLRNRDAVELALFFHDAVYDPARSDNEEASAALAREQLAALGTAPELTRRVSELILATRHGALQPEWSADGDLALLLDLDLAILGADRGEYAAYAAAIRREYGIYPDDLYRAGRRRVLGQFLSRPRIYLTERLHRLWDAGARANLAWELETLA